MTLFNQQTAVPEFKLFINSIPNVKVGSISDAQLWQYLQAGAKELERKLKVSLSPIEIFPDEPTSAELTALNSADYLVEPGYDLPPNFLSAQNFGAMQLRKVPVIAVHSITINYPGYNTAIFNIPMSWVRLDKKYGQIHLFPGNTPMISNSSIMTWQAMNSGQTIPHMIRVRYTAGIDASNGNYPDIVMLAQRMAALRMPQTAFLPQSGSISADGLSQSTSMDVQKLAAGLDDEIADLKKSLIGMVWGVL
jgi:hypothetical protein